MFARRRAVFRPWGGSQRGRPELFVKEVSRSAREEIEICPGREFGVSEIAASILHSDPADIPFRVDDRATHVASSQRLLH